jgi:hypothetical protein
MSEVKLTSGKGSMSERIANRLKPSNDHHTADHSASHGSGPTRTSSTIHHGGSQGSHGGGNDGPMSPLHQRDGGE